MTRQLNGILKLNDMDDVEEFSKKQMRSYLRKRNIRLSPHEEEDLLAYIISTIWELHAKKWNGKESFAGYAASIIHNRITDHFRKKWGRKGEKLAIEQSTPFSQLGEIESPGSDYDKADSLAALRGVFLG